MEHKIFVKESEIEGKGVFASLPIKKNEVICVMKGKKLSIPGLRKMYASGQERISDPLQIDDKTYLDLYEPYIYFNHSCNPSSAVLDGQRLIAIRDIRAGEEVTYDYSSTEWTDDSFSEWKNINDPNYKEWSIQCRCGSHLCRKTVGEFSSLPEAPKEYYIANGLVRTFIAERYRNSREAGK